MGMLLPPPQYDVPSPVPVIEHVMSADELWKVCNRIIGPLYAKDGWTLYGCSSIWRIKKTKEILSCEIYLLDTLPEKYQDENRHHEIGHCNGWPADHAGGIRR